MSTDSPSAGSRQETAVHQVAVLVAPADGVPVLRDVFRSLQGDFPGAIVILLHPSTGRERSVADNLNVASNFTVLPGVSGVSLRNGHAYVVPSDSGLVIGADGSLTSAYGADADADAILLGDERKDPRELVSRGDALIQSLADRYGAESIAVALTALDERESEGFRRVREAGGHTIALDETDRLWADSSGPRVIPDPQDELLSTAALGPRMNALMAPVVLAG